MSWATRATLILGIPWMLFIAILVKDGTPPTNWVYGLGLIGGGPVVLVWIMLRLILGDRGAIPRHH